MSVSRIAFATVIAAIAASAAGCQVEASVDVKTKTRFVEQNVPKEDTEDWTGQPIKIQIEGVGVAVNGGIHVTAVPGETRVKANARFLAMAFEDDKASADQSIIEAKNTFTITHSDSEIVVFCGHGGTHGSSNGGESGCELVNLTIPAGDADKPLELTVLGGNGTMTLEIAEATIKNVGANNGGDIVAKIPITQGANVSLVAEKADDITVTLPPNWAADEVILQADADKIVNPFTDVKLGAGAGGRGEPGTGLASLKLTSKEFAGSTGTITLQ